MKIKQLKKLGLIYLSIALFLPCLSHATVIGTADLLYSGIGARDNVTVWGGTAQGTGLYAGTYMFQKISGTGQGNIWNNYDVLGTFCMELTEPMKGNPISTYDVIMPSDGPRPTTFLGSTIGVSKEKYLQELWGRYYDPSWSNYSTTSAQDTKAAAFAIAIWEIVYEDFSGNPLDWDVTLDGTPGAGGFAADYINASIANDWLHSLDGTGPKTELRVFSIDGYQDFLVAVPEPMTIILLSAGSLVMLKRKRGA